MKHIRTNACYIKNETGKTNSLSFWRLAIFKISAKPMYFKDIL